MMFELEVEGLLRRWKTDPDDVGGEGDLADLRYVLTNERVEESLSDVVSMGSPFLRVNLSERVEEFGGGVVLGLARTPVEIVLDSEVDVKKVGDPGKGEREEMERGSQRGREGRSNEVRQGKGKVEGDSLVDLLEALDVRRSRENPSRVRVESVDS